MNRLNKYIFTHHIDDDVILLNQLNKQHIAISKEKYYLIKSKTDNIDDLNNIRPNLYSLMRKLEFIVPYEYSELENVKTNYNNSIFGDKYYRLTVIPTMNCNYNCWYCYETHEKSVMSKEVQDSIIKHIELKIQDDGIRGINLDWFGGEPTLYYKEIMVPLSRRLKEIADKNNIPISNQITTNGSLFTNEDIEIFEEINLKSFQITLDGNKYFHEKVKKGKNSYDKTVKNINNICKRYDDLSFVLRINYSNDNIESCKEIINDILPENRKKIKVSFQRIWQTQGEETEIDINPIKKHFEDAGFIPDLYNISFVHSCYADKIEEAVINYNGLIYKCTARDYNESNADGKLNSDGTIDWDITKYNKRFGTARFENDRCLECDLLPACYGPCSQKVIEAKKNDDFDKICNYDGFKTTIVELLEHNYYQNIK